MEEPDIGNAVALRCHTADSVDDADQRYLIPGNSYRFLGNGEALIRGGCFEIGRRYYQHQLGNIAISEATGAQVSSRFGSVLDTEVIQFLDSWLSWRRSHENGLDLTDNFYLDQRLGGWLSAVEQALDILPGTSVQPVNCERFFSSLMVPMSQEERCTGALQREVIRTLDRNLLKIPINPVKLEVKLRNVASATRRKVNSVLQWIREY
ncbi:hypothetical protein [Microvirga arabica]